MGANYSIGLDYGTNSVRTVLVDTANGREVATAVWNYAHGNDGVILLGSLRGLICSAIPWWLPIGRSGE